MFFKKRYLFFVEFKMPEIEIRNYKLSNVFTCFGFFNFQFLISLLRYNIKKLQITFDWSQRMPNFKNNF